jgi:hypothetical protein
MGWHPHLALMRLAEDLTLKNHRRSEKAEKKACQWPLHRPTSISTWTNNPSIVSKFPSSMIVSSSVILRTITLLVNITPRSMKSRHCPERPCKLSISHLHGTNRTHQAVSSLSLDILKVAKSLNNKCGGGTSYDSFVSNIQSHLGNLSVTH